MRRKIADISFAGAAYQVVHDTGCKRNPYKVYRKWYDNGWHRKKLTEWGDFPDAMQFLNDLCWSALSGYIPVHEFTTCTVAECLAMYGVKPWNGTAG